MKHIILMAILLGAWQAPERKDCSNIKVVVTGFRSEKGEGFLALYANQEGFPLDPAKATDKLKAPIEQGHAAFEFKAVKPGTYAIIALHDENKNGKMDRNPLGMPREGYGASNNPKMPLFGPPTFESAVFRTTPGAMTITIPLHYYPH